MSDGAGIRVGLLGPLELVVGSQPTAVGGRKARILLAHLALELGRVVSTDRLVAGLWGDAATPGATATLQVHISKLRQVFGTPAIDYRPPGYVLSPVAVDTDLAAFRRTLLAARVMLTREDAVGAAEAMRAALALWRGEPLADLADAFPVPVAALARERRAATELWLDAELLLGHGSDVAAATEALCREHPLDEGAVGRHMRALYQAGRQAEALAAFRAIRERLDEELGLEPGPELRAVETAVLSHAPRLGGSAAAGEAGVSTFRWEPSDATACLVTATGERISLVGERTTIGRADDCDIPLAQRSVSRRHAVIGREGAGHVVIDLSSTNGTRLNRQSLEPGCPAPLADRDEIGVGAVTLVYHSG